MRDRALHPGPDRMAVAIEQLRAVGLAIRREAAVVTALGIALIGMIAVKNLSPNYSDRIDFLPQMVLPLFILAFVYPLAVWKTEHPEMRSYLWSLPVARGRHHLLKLVAGWIWLMAATGVYALCIFGGALATGGRVGETTRYLMGADGRLEPFHLTVPGWQWLAPLAGVTIAYLLGAIPAVLSNRPFWWIIGGVMAVVFFGNLPAEWAFLREPIERALGSGAPYGLLVAAVGEVRIPMVWGQVSYSISRPDLGAWLTATALWLGIGLAAVWLAARKHLEA